MYVYSYQAKPIYNLYVCTYHNVFCSCIGDNTTTTTTATITTDVVTLNYFRAKNESKLSS